MKTALLVAGIVSFSVAAVLLFAGSAAINPLGLVAIGLALTTTSHFV